MYMVVFLIFFQIGTVTEDVQDMADMKDIKSKDDSNDDIAYDQRLHFQRRRQDLNINTSSGKEQRLQVPKSKRFYL